MSDERRPGRRIHRLPPREDVERELRVHLAQREEELISDGWDAESAMQEARRLFGDYAAIHDESVAIASRHDQTRGRSRMWSELRQDLRYAGRGVARAPGFAALAVITLTLGIGATSAAFAIVNGVLLAPLPYPEPERLVAFWEVSEGGHDNPVTYPNFRDFQREARTLDGIAVYQMPWRALVLGGSEPMRAAVARVSASLFDVLDARPARGRGFALDDMVPGGPRAVLVSEAFWRNQLGAPGDLAGLAITLDGVSADVIGVMPGAFDFPRGADIWVPSDIVDPADLGTRTAHNFRGIARLARGASIELARQDLTRITQEIREQEPGMTAVAVNVRDLRDASVGDSRRALMILLGASAFVLLVACTNLASGLLARAARRRHELAVRASLGAHRPRIVRQLLTESVFIAGIGAVVGLLLAFVLVRLVIAMGPDAVPRLHDVRLDARVVTFTMLLGFVTAILFGTFPALRATRGDTFDTIRGAGRGTESIGQRRAWSWLVGAEVALAMLLLVGSGLLIRSFHELTNVHTGFDADDRLTVQISLPPRLEEATRPQLFDQVLERVRALPDVTNAAIAWTLPLVDFDPWGTFYVEGRDGGAGNGGYRVVGEGFFETMGTPLLRGRDFTPADRAGAEDVIIINERLADLHFPDEDPIGQRIRTGGMDSRGDVFATIIGIVGDVRTQRLDAPPVAGYYLTYRQRTGRLASATLVVRGIVNPLTLAGPVRDIVREMDSEIVAETGLLRERIGASLADRRFMLFVLGAFAAIALLLSAVGIYAVVAFAVAARTTEIGIRMALGASAPRVLWTVSRGTMLSVVAGAALGLIFAAWLSRLIAAMLYETDPLDPLTFVAVAGLLLATASVAVVVPAQRSTRVNPVTALHSD